MDVASIHSVGKGQTASPRKAAGASRGAVKAVCARPELCASQGAVWYMSDSHFDMSPVSFWGWPWKSIAMDLNKEPPLGHESPNDVHQRTSIQIHAQIAQMLGMLPGTMACNMK